MDEDLARLFYALHKSRNELYEARDSILKYLNEYDNSEENSKEEFLKEAKEKFLASIPIKYRIAFKILKTMSIKDFFDIFQDFLSERCCNRVGDAIKEFEKYLKGE